MSDGAVHTPAFGTEGSNSPTETSVDHIEAANERYSAALGSKYRLISLRGKGGFARVYKAKELHGDRLPQKNPEGKSRSKKVAIKIIDNILRSHRHARQALRELSILRQLTEMQEYDHVCSLHDAILHQDTNGHWSLLLVSDLQTMDLDRHLKKKEISEEGVIKHFYQLLCSLNFLHSANVMHRDIKPQNILVNEEGDLILSDFGLARVLPTPSSLKTPKDKPEISRRLRDERASRQRKPRHLSPHVVSRYYRPPEVILMEKDYTETVDLWSGACVVSELLSCSDSYLKIGFKKEKRVLFKGKSCAPLSPERKISNFDTVYHPESSSGEAQEDNGSIFNLGTVPSQTDQLQLIMNLLGTPSEQDVSFVSDEEALSYIFQLRNSSDLVSKVQWEKEYSQSDARLSKLLSHMYQFNPHFRAPARRLLKSSLFDNVRNEKMEKPALQAVQLDVDEADALEFSVEAILEKIEKEVKQLKK